MSISNQHILYPNNPVQEVTRLRDNYFYHIIIVNKIIGSFGAYNAKVLRDITAGTGSFLKSIGKSNFPEEQ